MGVVGWQSDALSPGRCFGQLGNGADVETFKKRPVFAGNRTGEGPSANALLHRDLIGIDVWMNEAGQGMGAARIGDDLKVVSHDQTLAFLLSNVNRTSVVLGDSAVAMTPGDRLRTRREERGLSASDLAERVGRSVSAVRNQENGTNGIPASLAKKYAAALGTTAAWLLYGDDTPESVAGTTTEELPLIGPIQAGAWLTLDDSVQDDPIMVTAIADRRYPHARQWLREVRGDSMNARGIMPGDLAHIVEITGAGVNLNSGMVVEVTRTRDGGGLREITLKEVEIGPDGMLLWPRSSNPKWKDPVRLDDGGEGDLEVQITGLLLQSIKRFL